jgi:hypothetical protein
MKRYFRSDPLVNFFLSSPSLAFTRIIRLRQLFERLVAAIFQAPLNKEHRCRSLKAGGGFCVLGLISLAGRFEWRSAECLERSQRRRIRIRKPRRQQSH